MMEVFFDFSYWFFLVQFWVIFGIIFICLEIIDGSFIFFLPIGAGSLCNALILFFQKIGIFNEYVPLTMWHHTLVSLGVFSIGVSIFLRVFNRKKDIDDPNHY